MFPLRDENPSRTPPLVTRSLIAVNAAAFLFQWWLGPEGRGLVVAWGLVPVRLVQGFAAGPDAALASLPPLLTSMFLHGGWLHLVGNLWYLWIFGDNVEDRLGHLRFLLFYLAAGLAAAAVHVLSGPAAHVPTIGASGAVAGVLGAYLVLYPRARVLTLLPLFPFFQVVALPAVLLLGLWLLFQFVSGTLSLGSTGGGVAWWAHVGGFVFGMAVARLGRARPG